MLTATRAYLKTLSLGFTSVGPSPAWGPFAFVWPLYTHIESFAAILFYQWGFPPRVGGYGGWSASAVFVCALCPALVRIACIRLGRIHSRMQLRIPNIYFRLRLHSCGKFPHVVAVSSWLTFAIILSRAVLNAGGPGYCDLAHR